MFYYWRQQICSGQTAHLVDKHFLPYLNGDRQQFITNFKIKKGNIKISLDILSESFLSNQTQFSAVTSNTLSNKLTKALFYQEA